MHDAGAITSRVVQPQTNLLAGAQTANAKTVRREGAHTNARRKDFGNGGAGLLCAWETGCHGNKDSAEYAKTGPLLRGPVRLVLLDDFDQF